MFDKPNLYKKPAAKAVLSALSLSILLSLSACSDDKETAAVEPVADTEQVAADPAPSVETTEVASAEPAAAVDTTESVETYEVAAEPEVLAADAGAQLYEAQCKVCHDNVLLNAPKYGDKAAWSAPLAKDKQTLYSHSAQGFNKMPAQAVNGISEAQVKAAVDYMLEAVS